MLLSLGHLPCHLSSPSPLEIPISINDKSTVRSNDSFSQIILGRDYFPDFPKLRDCLDWLETVRFEDLVPIREAQLKILECRRRIVTSSGGGDVGTNSKFRTQTLTPGSNFPRNLSFTPYGLEDNTRKFDENKTIPAVGSEKNGDSLDDGDYGEDDVDVSLTLDEFFRWYTSEANESFSKIMDKVNRERKERYDHLLEGKREGNIKLIGDGKRECVSTGGFGTSD